MGTARAWGWVAHLREGGTTPWHAWTGDGVPTARFLPGGQQLELLRRLNIASPVMVDHREQRDHNKPLRAGLADRVLTAAAPGRGKPDLPLLGASASAYGPQAVDPTLLPADELIRVATSVLAEDVVALGVRRPRRRLRRPWGQDFRIVGNPLEAAHVREHLTPRRPASRTGAHVVVLGGPLEEMLADVWTRRCFERGSGGWLEWLRFWQQRGDLPPRIDLPAVVGRHLGRHPHVQVVLDRWALPELLGVRRMPPPIRPGADAAELARRIATVIGLLVPPEERAALMTHTLLPRIPATRSPQVVLPEEHRAWVGAAAQRMARELRRAGYPVLGDPAVLVPKAGLLQTETAAPGLTEGSATPAPGELVLDLAVRMLVDEGWKKGSR